MPTDLLLGGDHSSEISLYLSSRVQTFAYRVTPVLLVKSFSVDTYTFCIKHATVVYERIYMQKARKKYYRRSPEFQPKQHDPIKLAYLAGIIDGEGCLYIGQATSARNGKIIRHHRCCLKVDSTDQILIDWLIDNFDGLNSAHTRWTSKKKYEREVHTWVVTGDKLLELCEQILPYLVIKKAHCENIIKFRKTFTNKIGQHTKPSEEALQIREECLKVSRQLNSRWHNHPLKNPSPLLP